MPCLNEEGGVASCIADAETWLRQSGLSGEVIIVDNGSTDRSAEIAMAAGARVVSEPRRGYGSAVRRGFREARGNYLVMGDCDGSYDFAALDQFIAPIDRGETDLVIGNRLTDGLVDGAMPWAHRFIGTPVISYIIRAFTGLRIGDSQCGLRSIRRDALERLSLRARGMEFASEMLVEAARHKLRIKEVPITYRARVGEAKLRTFRDGWRHLQYLIRSKLAPGTRG
jgi:glycosyltransferase involved in cell wall biosynthesis